MIIQYMQGPLWRTVLAALLLAGRVAAAPAFTGASKCATCHPDQAGKQAASAHASALRPAVQHPLAGAFPSGRKLQRGALYGFDFAFRPPSFQVRITDGKDRMELPVEWAFGAGRQAVTFVTKVNKDWYVEHYASYYPALGGYGPTPGQSALQPSTLPEAAGLIYKVADPVSGIAGCFECHTTGPVSFGKEGEANVTELGVRCESCHDAGSEHARNPGRVRPRNPGRMTAVQINDLCGRCHRPPAAAGVKIDWNYSWNVRHAPVYLSQSRCFQMSKGKLSCLSCHDPHEPAGQKRIAEYNQHCGSCHKAAHGPANCVDCHMPLVSPQSPLRFTNHWIGTYGTGAKLRPVR